MHTSQDIRQQWKVGDIINYFCKLVKACIKYLSIKNLGTIFLVFKIFFYDLCLTAILASMEALFI